MKSKCLQALFPIVYLIWAVYLLDIPHMPHPHAADIGFLSVWAFRSLNLIGGALFMAVVQICWHAHVWFFSPSFQQLSTGGFVVLVTLILLTGMLQWMGVGMLLERLHRAIRKPRTPAASPS